MKPEHVAIKNNGGRTGMYSVIELDGKFDEVTVEKYIATVESKAGTLFPRLERQEAINLPQKIILAQFISLMFRRVPFIFDNFAPKHLPGMMPGMRQDSKERVIASEKIKNKRETIANIDRMFDLLEAHPNSVTSLAILNSEPAGSFMFGSLNVGFLYSDSVHFVTSDCPVVFDRTSGIGNFERGHVLFPITKNLIAWLTQWPIYPNSYWLASPDLVQWMNRRIVRNAYQEVFADQYSTELESLVNSQIALDLV